MSSSVTVHLNNPNHPLYLQHWKLFKVMVTVLFINRIWQPLSLWSGHLFTHSLMKDLWVNDDELITDTVTDLSQWDVRVFEWSGSVFRNDRATQSLLLSLRPRRAPLAVQSHGGAHGYILRLKKKPCRLHSSQWSQDRPRLTPNSSRLLCEDSLFSTLLRTWPVIRLRQDSSSPFTCDNSFKTGAKMLQAAGRTGGRGRRTI